MQFITLLGGAIAPVILVPRFLWSGPAGSAPPKRNRGRMKRVAACGTSS